MKNKKKLEMTLSITILVVCVLLYSFFPTNNIFEEIVSFAVFIFIIPTLYLKIVLHKKISDGSKKQHFLLQILFGIVLGIVLGILLSLLFSALHIITSSYRESILVFSDNKMLFFINELRILIFNIFGSVAIGYFFVRRIFSDYKFKSIIAYITTTILLFTSDEKWILGIIAAISIPLLSKLKKDTFITIATILFFTILVFDTLIIKHII